MVKRERRTKLALSLSLYLRGLSAAVLRIAPMRSAGTAALCVAAAASRWKRTAAMVCLRKRKQRKGQMVDVKSFTEGRESTPVVMAREERAGASTVF